MAPRDLAGDLVLHLEDVLHLPVVAFGPDRVSRRGVDELGRDAETLPRPPDAPFEHECRSELLADLGRRDRLVPERQHHRPRIDLEALDLRELRDDVFGDAVAEVLVFLGTGEILEIEDGHGLRGCASPLGVGGSAARRRRSKPFA
jgi:hypothetical protein